MCKYSSSSLNSALLLLQRIMKLVIKEIWEWNKRQNLVYYSNLYYHENKKFLRKKHIYLLFSTFPQSVNLTFLVCFYSQILFNPIKMNSMDKLRSVFESNGNFQILEHFCRELPIHFLYYNFTDLRHVD